MTSNYLLNLNPNNSFPVKTGYTFKNGDKGITFIATIMELDTSGMTAKIVFHRSNGTSVEATLSGNGPTYSYTTLGNEFAVPGIVVADIKLYNGSETQRVSTASFVFNVISDTMDGVGGGTAGYSDELEVLSQEFEDTLQEYKDAFGELLPVRPRGEWNSTTDYEILDLVSHNGSSYVCREDNTNVEPPNATKWQLFATGYSGPITASQVTYGNSNVGSALDNAGTTMSVNSAKNWLPNDVVSTSLNGLTITRNADDSITISGTASANTDIYVHSFGKTDHINEVSSSFILNGCPAGGSLPSYVMSVFMLNRSTLAIDDVRRDTGGGTEAFVISSADYLAHAVISIAAGTVITTPITFKPMIRLATDANDTYQPYAKTNQELTPFADYKKTAIDISGVHNIVGGSLDIRRQGKVNVLNINFYVQNLTDFGGGAYVELGDVPNTFESVNSASTFCFNNDNGAVLGIGILGIFNRKVYLRMPSSYSGTTMNTYFAGEVCYIA